MASKRLVSRLILVLLPIAIGDQKEFTNSELFEMITKQSMILEHQSKVIDDQSKAIDDQVKLNKDQSNQIESLKQVMIVV